MALTPIFLIAHETQNPFRLSRKHLPEPHGGVRDEAFGGGAGTPGSV